MGDIKILLGYSFAAGMHPWDSPRPIRHISHLFRQFPWHAYCLLPTAYIMEDKISCKPLYLFNLIWHDDTSLHGLCNTIECFTQVE